MGTVSQPETYTGPHNANFARNLHQVQFGSHVGNGGLTTQQSVCFIQNIASQVQMLACLRWLGEFQVLALIPLQGVILASDVAELAGVPKTQLARVVRMAATAGFLREPHSGYLAHTALSADFVTTFSLLDATMFLAESAGPTALQMAAATHVSESAYSIALNTREPFRAACKAQGRLQRQWAAYQQCANTADESLADVLGGLNWGSLGNATIVHVNAGSVADIGSLPELYPTLRFVMQMAAPEQSRPCRTANAQVQIQQRTNRAQQAVKDASMYILQTRSLGSALRKQLQDELKAHASILFDNPSASMIVAAPLLPEPGSVHHHVEMRARLRDLHHLQLNNEEAGLEVCELEELVSSNMHPSGGGRLALVNKLQYADGSIAAVSIMYRPASDRISSSTSRSSSWSSSRST